MKSFGTIDDYNTRFCYTDSNGIEKQDLFEMYVSGFPKEAEVHEIKRCLEKELLMQRCTPKTIEIFSAKATGLPKIGFIEFNSKEELEGALYNLYSDRNAGGDGGFGRNLSGCEFGITTNMAKQLKMNDPKIESITNAIKRMFKTMFPNNFFFPNRNDEIEVQIEAFSKRIEALLDENRHLQRLESDNAVLVWQQTRLKGRITQIESKLKVNNAELARLKNQLELQRLKQFQLPDEKLEIDFVTNDRRPERLASSDTVILKGDDDRLEQKFTIGKLKLSVGFLTEI